MQIIPAILADNEEEFRAKVAHVRALGLLVQIDVCDGEFVPRKSWAPPEMMSKILGELPFEAHLMVANPEHLVPVWLAAGATRVYYHSEATKVDGYMVRSVEPDDTKLGITLNPDTPVSRVIPALEHIRHVMVMGVTPGWSGQGFQEIALEKVRAIRLAKPSVFISIDGGIRPENAKAALDAGADAIVSGSGITDQPDPTEALRTFEAALGMNQ